MQLSGGREQLHHWKWWALTMALQQVPREALLAALLQLKAPRWWQPAPRQFSNHLLALQMQLQLRAALH